VPEHLERLDVLDDVHRLGHPGSLEEILAWTIILVQTGVNPPGARERRARRRPASSCRKTPAREWNG
jgi:hypothetical protein